MKSSDLVRVVADRSNVPEDVVARVVTTLFVEIERRLERGVRVNIRDFGTWRAVRLTGSVRPNPGTGQRVQFPPSRTVRWKPAVHLRQRLNEKCLTPRDTKTEAVDA